MAIAHQTENFFSLTESKLMPASWPENHKIGDLLNLLCYFSLLYEGVNKSAK